MSRIWMWDDRWEQEVADFAAHAAKLKTGDITDVVPVIWGHFRGGTVGWISTGGVTRTCNIVRDDALADYITEMNALGIRVHGAFVTCRYLSTDDGTGGNDWNYAIDPNDTGSQLVDPKSSGVIGNPAEGIFFNDHISDIAEEACQISGMAGIVLDFIRTGDLTETEAANDAAIESIVQKSYDKIKAVRPNCIVSSWGSSYKDTQHPTLKLWGRKMLNWLNLGIMDTIHAAETHEYFTWAPNPGPKSWGGLPTDEVGTIINKRFMELLRAMQTNSRPVLAHAITWKTVASPVAIDAGDQWTRILDSLRFEEDISLYTAWLITDAQLLALAEHRRLHGWVPTYQL